MEVVDETMGSSNDHSSVIKGRRTKRQRPSSPLSLSMSTSSSNAGGVSDYQYMSPTSSIEFAEEEQDMANCLILLAQGPNPKQNEFEERSKLKHMTEATQTTATSMGGKSNGRLYVYECKTCNRCFPSFQALGGHRASHKKPKTAVVEEKKSLVLYQDNEETHLNFNNNGSPLRNRGVATINKSSKIHECSICGAEFSSGQALGGHMRRHRTSVPPPPPPPTTTTTTNMNENHQPEMEKPLPRHVLGLDLNLPAPEEDTKFAFVSKQPPMIFSTSSLVDCHY